MGPYEEEDSDVVAVATVGPPGVTIAIVNLPLSGIRPAAIDLHDSIADRKQGLESILHWVKDDNGLGPLATSRNLLVVNLLDLQLHQPVRRFGKNSEGGKLAPHHGNLIAVMKSGADVAIFVNLVGKIFSLRHLKSLARKKFRERA